MYLPSTFIGPIQTSEMSNMGDESKKVFEVELDDIEDIELIEDIERAQADGRLNDHLRNLLRLGHSVHLAATFQTSQESMQTLLSPLDSRIQSLNNLVENLTGSFIGSSTKGGIGEQIVIGHLSTAFTGSKGDQFTPIADEGHTGDIAASMAIETSAGVSEYIPAMIEVKLYDKAVGSDEVDKFWDDLKENNYKYGLFVSLTSGIANQDQCIAIESRGGKYGILVYSDNLEQLRHIVAYAMMRELACLVESGKDIKSSSQDVLATLVSDLSNDLGIFESGVSLIGSIERAAVKILSETGKQVTAIMSSSGQLRESIEQGVARMEHDIRKASLELDDEKTKLLDWNKDNWTPLLKKFPDKMAHLLTAMRQSIIELDELTTMTLVEDSDKPTVKFSDGEVDIIEIEAQSTKIQIRIIHQYDEIPAKIPGVMKKGVLVIDIPQTAAAIGDVDWPKLGEILLAPVSD